jgi:hypothetical protein
LLPGPTSYGAGAGDSARERGYIIALEKLTPSLYNGTAFHETSQVRRQGGREESGSGDERDGAAESESIIAREGLTLALHCCSNINEGRTAYFGRGGISRAA